MDCKAFKQVIDLLVKHTEKNWALKIDTKNVIIKQRANVHYI